MAAPLIWRDKMFEAVIFVGMLGFVYVLMREIARVTGSVEENRPAKLFDFTRPNQNVTVLSKVASSKNDGGGRRA